MMFSSKSPNLDPLPYKHPDVPLHKEVKGLRYSYPIKFISGRSYYSPRAEFALETVHPANPILEAFRGNVEDPDTEMGEETFLDVVEMWKWYLDTGNQEVSDDPEHIKHAREVIGRLWELTPAGEAGKV